MATNLYNNSLDNSYYLKIACGVFAICFIVLYKLSHLTMFHTDESWSFSESWYFSQGMMPYKDYFSHRLPFESIVYGVWIKMFDGTLMSGRLLSCFMSSFAIAITTFVSMKITKNVIISLLSALVFSNILVLYLLSAFSDYPIVVLLFSLACVTLLLKNRILGNSLFLVINSLIWMSRYLVDVQVIILIIFLILFIYQVRSIKISIVYVIAAFFIPALFIVQGGYKLFYDTFTFNMMQLKIEESIPGVLNKGVTTFFERFIHMRKLEIREFYPMLALSIISIIYLLSKPKDLYRKILNGVDSSSLILLYSFLFVAGYYSFIMLSGWDFPITKIYFLPALSIIIAYSISEFIPYKQKNTRSLLVLLFLPMIFWPYLQNRDFLHTDKAVDLKEEFNQKLTVYPDKSGEFLTFMPVLLQNGIKIDKDLSMEIFSFLHNLTPKQADYYHLASINKIISNIKNKKYEGLILDDTRYKKTTGMGAILNSHRAILYNTVNSNYTSISSFKIVPFGNITLYKKKH